MKPATRNRVMAAMVAAHRVALRFKVQVAPRHYYSSAPDLLELDATRERWSQPSSMPGLNWNLDDQLDYLRTSCEPFLDEYVDNRTYTEATAAASGPGYGPIEAQALHGILRSLRPRRYVEVGSGVSTMCALAALEQNEGEGASPTSVICIEPYPSARLRAEDRIELIESFVQDVPLSTFDHLESGDVLFIDSTHVVKPGSDVNHIVLEILPRLRAGVVVHFHDIYLPYDHQRNLTHSLFHWAETSMLRAYLCDNARVEILCCLSALHYESADGLVGVFPSYRPEPSVGGLSAAGHKTTTHHFPSSLWFRLRH